MYPSGLWTGYWEQTLWGRQSMHELQLQFDAGEVHGSGWDVIGPFSFHGQYDENGLIVMTKRYVGKHTVLYRGQYDGEGTIFGRWSIGELWTGPFALRLPRSRHVATVAEESILELVT